MFDTRANDLHRALWRDRSVKLAAYRRDFAYLGLNEAEYERRLRAVHEALVLPYVYWAQVTAEPVTRATVWTKIGPLCDDEETERHRARLTGDPPSHRWVHVTREPDDGVNSPFPRGLVVAACATDGARGLHRDLRGPVDTSRWDDRARAFAELAVPVLTSRPVTREQFRAAHWRDDEPAPATADGLRELLLGYGYLPGWLDLAVRIALEDLAGDLPDARWAVPSTARRHWWALFVHWGDRWNPPSPTA
ncbi:hypothetical protein [Kitasatospora sp. NPDC048407]|uniref:hypothetical protein n=1 Tax=Kitasatospora sp. NPDC048407 TaxID=3364051 RepID=UPI00371B465E